MARDADARRDIERLGRENDSLARRIGGLRETLDLLQEAVGYRVFPGETLVPDSIIKLVPCKECGHKREERVK